MKPENNGHNAPSNLEDLADHLKAYVNTSYELFRLKTVDKVSSTSSSLVAYIVVFFLVGLVVLLVSVGAALFLNTFLDNIFSGFFIVAAFYIVLAVLIYFGRKSLIKTPVNNKIINELLNH